MSIGIPPTCLHDDLLSLSVSSCLMELGNKQQSSCGKAACHIMQTQNYYINTLFLRNQVARTFSSIHFPV